MFDIYFLILYVQYIEMLMWLQVNKWATETTSI